MASPVLSPSLGSAARSPPLPPSAAAPVVQQVASASTAQFAGAPIPPATFLPPNQISKQFPGPDAPHSKAQDGKMLLELTDGSAYEGYSFGADKTISGECVFQTGVHSAAP